MFWDLDTVWIIKNFHIIIVVAAKKDDYILVIRTQGAADFSFCCSKDLSGCTKQDSINSWETAEMLSFHNPLIKTLSSKAGPMDLYPFSSRRKSNNLWTSEKKANTGLFD